MKKNVILEEPCHSWIFSNLNADWEKGHRVMSKRYSHESGLQCVTLQKDQYSWKKIIFQCF